MLSLARSVVSSAQSRTLSTLPASSSILTFLPRFSSSLSTPLDTFEARHLGPKDAAVKEMLRVIGEDSLDTLTTKIVPKAIQLGRELKLTGSQRIRGENELLQEFRSMMSKNQLLKNYIGTGYYGTITPPVILRNLLENPAWYTPYTPYQGEIAQGRLESLLNYQTMIGDLTGLPFANSSLLDEATAAAEAMSLCYAHCKQERAAFFVSSLCHPQVISLVRTRAEPLNIKVHIGDHNTFDFAKNQVSGALIQYPATEGHLVDYSSFIKKAHENGALVVAATDLLACTLIKPPGELGVDIAVGSAQRFGVPLNYGGPHAAFFAVKDMNLVRKMPGRIIGVSKDSRGKPVYRMSLQAREQHIRREKATSNICTAQALLANIAAMYAIYHGPKGLRDIAERVHSLTALLADGLSGFGFNVDNKTSFFDTLKVNVDNVPKLIQSAVAQGSNLRALDKAVGISFDETTTLKDVSELLKLFAAHSGKSSNANDLSVAALEKKTVKSVISSSSFKRKSEYLTHPVFNSYHSETEMLRYIFKLSGKDVGLHISMIPLGSCTMKLNATSEMIPVTWPEITNVHPFAPLEQTKVSRTEVHLTSSFPSFPSFSARLSSKILTSSLPLPKGYQEMFSSLESDLAEITGFAKVSLQPNAGSQGEYAGLLVIREYFKNKGQGHRDVCLIPVSAHGTNPAR
jgi:glycine dehydrogenase